MARADTEIKKLEDIENGLFPHPPLLFDLTLFHLVHCSL